LKNSTEKNALLKLFLNLNGYAWSKNIGWISTVQNLNGSFVTKSLNTSASLFDGIKTINNNLELQSKNNGNAVVFSTIDEINLSGFIISSFC
jgi:hypothetical protein